MKKSATLIKWGASSRWSSSLYYPIQNSDQMTIGKTHHTLSIVTTESKKFRRIETKGRVLYWTWNFWNKNIPSSRNQKRDVTLGFSGIDLAGNNVLDIPKRFNSRGFRSSDVICSDFLRLLRSWIVFLCREILTRFYPSDLRLDSF